VRDEDFIYCKPILKTQLPVAQLAAKISTVNRQLLEGLSGSGGRRRNLKVQSSHSFFDWDYRNHAFSSISPWPVQIQH